MVTKVKRHGDARKTILKAVNEVYETVRLSLGVEGASALILGVCAAHGEAHCSLGCAGLPLVGGQGFAMYCAGKSSLMTA